MKIKNGFIRREIAGFYIIVPVGQNKSDFNGMVKLNETGNFLWEKLEVGATKEELLSALLDEYDVTADVAMESIEKFLADIKPLNCLE